MLFAALTGVLSGVASGDTTTSVTPLDIKGGGAWGPYRELVDWQNALGDTDSAAKPSIPINLDYTRNGSFAGREAFLHGDTDFAVSGVPFTDEELKSLPGGKDDLIAAPFDVTAIAFLVAAPNPESFTEIKTVPPPCDPLTDPDQCVQVVPYTGPLKIPNENLGSMVLRQGPGFPKGNAWDNPAVLQANNVEGWTINVNTGPGTILRSDADETNYYLQQFVKAAAPKTWASILSTFHQYQWEPIAERWPRVPGGASREGLEQQSLPLGQGGIDPLTGGYNQSTSGTIGALAPSSMEQVLEVYPVAQIQWAYMQNANNDWVAPNPDTINAAVDAGGDQPLYALTNKTPNAYPLVWVDKIYVKSSGLSADKTEALATMIRYVATAGQSVMVQHNDGRLSSDLVKQALTAADDVVQSNCKGSDRVLVKDSTPGRFAPNLDAIKAIGPMFHCNSKAAPPTTRATTPTTFAPFNPSSNLSTTPFPTLPALPSAVAATGAPAADQTSNDQDVKSAALTASKLPLEQPSGSGGFDRTAAVVLGAGLYLLLRGPSRRLLRLGAE